MASSSCPLSPLSDIMSKRKSACQRIWGRFRFIDSDSHLPDGHGSGKVQQAIVRKMARLPELMRNSLTWDQGSEMALHGKISVALDMGVYFCGLHSPWQRGANENTNGLLRQYFPKGTDLSIFPEEYLDAVAEELNDRPRKTLGWRKPSEVFLGLINNDSLTA